MAGADQGNSFGIYRASLTYERAASFPSWIAERTESPPSLGLLASAVPAPALAGSFGCSPSQMAWFRSWDFPPAQLRRKRQSASLKRNCPSALLLQRSTASPVAFPCRAKSSGEGQRPAVSLGVGSATRRTCAAPRAIGRAPALLSSRGGVMAQRPDQLFGHTRSGFWSLTARPRARCRSGKFTIDRLACATGGTPSPPTAQVSASQKHALSRHVTP